MSCNEEDFSVETATFPSACQLWRGNCSNKHRRSNPQLSTGQISNFSSTALKALVKWEGFPVSELLYLPSELNHHILFVKKKSNRISSPALAQLKSRDPASVLCPAKSPALHHTAELTDTSDGAFH